MTSDFLKDDDWLDTVSQYFRNDYRERGKVKWNGFFLSDHTAKLKKDSQLQEEQEQATWLEKMTFFSVQQQVLLAYQNSWRLLVQENTVDANRQIPLPKVGLVTGFYDNGFYLDKRAVDWENARYTEVQRGRH